VELCGVSWSGVYPAARFAENRRISRNTEAETEAEQRMDLTWWCQWLLIKGISLQGKVVLSNPGALFWEAINGRLSGPTPVIAAADGMSN